MTITLGPDLESALNDLAHKQGVTPEVLAVNALRERFLAPRSSAATARRVGSALAQRSDRLRVVSSHEAVSSEGLYE